MCHTDGQHQKCGPQLGPTVPWVRQSLAGHCIRKTIRHYGNSKGRSSWCFLSWQRSFSECNMVLQMFYQSVMASCLFFAIACWIDQLHPIVGATQDLVKDVMMVQLDAIMDNHFNSIHLEIVFCDGSTLCCNYCTFLSLPSLRPSLNTFQELRHHILRSQFSTFSGHDPQNNNISTADPPSCTSTLNCRSWHYISLTLSACFLANHHVCEHVDQLFSHCCRASAGSGTD